MNTKRQGPALYLLLVYAFYFLYYFADMQTSANTMVKQTESRGQVHLYLIVLIVLLAVYFLSRGRWQLNDSFRGSFFIMICWCACADLLVGANFWSIATHLGLLVLFYLAYYFGGHYVDTQRKYRLILMLEFVLWCITLWYAISAYLAFQEYHDGERDVVLNMAYNILVFIPVLMQLKNRAIKGISVGISVIYIVASLKRGAIITMVAMFLVASLINAKDKPKSLLRIKLKTMIKVILAVIALAIVAVVVDNQMGGALSRRFSLESLRSGSNRNVLYAAAWKDIIERPVLLLFAGRGSGSSLQIINSGVHNEILEYLFSYGIIGLLMYVVTMFNGVRWAVKMKEEESQGRMLYAMGITYLICVGLFGSAMFSHMSFHIMLAMGLAHCPVNTAPERMLTDG